jgi:hypothetical protein
MCVCAMAHGLTCTAPGQLCSLVVHTAQAQGNATLLHPLVVPITFCIAHLLPGWGDP